MTTKSKKVMTSDIRKGFRFDWRSGHPDFDGIYEVICFRKNLSVILCYKPAGREATIRTEELAKFDERIVNNQEFRKL